MKRKIRPITPALVEWAQQAFVWIPFHSMDPEVRYVYARSLALNTLQRECGHDCMKQLHGFLWQCQGCGQVQEADAEGKLRQPGTRVPNEPADALGTELVAWDTPFR